MAKFELIKITDNAIQTGRADLNLIANGSAGLRVINTAKQILRGDQDVPTSVGSLFSLLNNNVFTQRPDKYYYVSTFNTPVRNYVKFEAGSYRTLDKNGNVVDKLYPEFLLDSAIVKIAMPKNVVTTPVNGRSGTRKEYINDGDYQIRITGTIASNHTSIYPEQSVNDLYRILQSPEELSVICPQLQRFGINTIYVQEFSFDQEEGIYNQQKIRISAISHEPIDIYLENVEREANRRESRLTESIEAANDKLRKVRDKVNEVTGGILDRGGNQLPTTLP